MVREISWSQTIAFVVVGATMLILLEHIFGMSAHEIFTRVYWYIGGALGIYFGGTRKS